MNEHETSDAAADGFGAAHAPEAILADLNEEQRTAVTAPPLPALVLAGAGSGKTRVLTHRIAWLCRTENLSPYSIAALTFTNKAAQEMRSRVEQLLDMTVSGMWFGTFHGVCHRLLRLHHADAGLPQTFQVLDAQDQRRLVKRVTQTLGLDEAHWPARQSQWFINDCKEAGTRPASVQDLGDDHSRRQMLRIYTAYEEARRNAGLVDFAELLLRALELLRDNAGLQAHYRERFRHILVDEFQDTNALQYALIRVLAGADIPVFAVGDDDQSIYGWRGARVGNLHAFTKDFARVQVFRLERNYRSTATILDAANALIGHNRGRMGKSLWTDSGAGAPITVFAAFNELDEAAFVVERLRAWAGRKRRYSEAAVLYRSNAQSRVIESALIAEDIPYRIYGGLRFFERAVVKNALAYLRLMMSRQDDPSFERVVNFPPRGIGERTLGRVRAAAQAQNASLWAAALSLLKRGGGDGGNNSAAENALGGRAAGALGGFCDLIENLACDSARLSLAEMAGHVADLLIAHYRKDSSEAARTAIENLEEFTAAAREFERLWRDDDADGEQSVADAFLAHAALEAGEGQGRADEDCVQLMTLHSAKGLEFPSVTIAGLEEGLFPHERSFASASLSAGGEGVEEERRLCYVGITRAREELALSFAETRNRGWGKTACNEPSRFLGEIPPQLLAEVRPRLHIARPPRTARTARAAHAAHTGAAAAGAGAREGALQIGQSVEHKKFGRGVVIACEGAGEHARANVRFERAGDKWLMLMWANLKTL